MNSKKSLNSFDLHGNDNNKKGKSERKMSFISFNYTIRGSNVIFVGKYVTYYLSDDHEGLDELVKPYLLKSLNTWRARKSLRPLRRQDIKVGVTGFADGCGRVPTYSSSAAKEAKIFDFYYDESEEYKAPKVFVNGKPLVETCPVSA